MDSYITYPAKAIQPAAKAVAVPRVFFPNFDGIRFIAALMVMLQHLSNYKTDIDPSLANHEQYQVASLGQHGVTLFFVLSGFLIFYLLFVEKEFTGTVRIRDFYVRRILRIWPLYFGFGLISIIGIDYVLSSMGQPVLTPISDNLFYLLTFSINLQLIFAPINRGIIELYWSVCIEEQFYLFAPWLVKKTNRFLAIAVFLIILGIGSKFLLEYLIVNGYLAANSHINPLYLFTTCWMDAFGIGILAAYLLFNKSVYNRIRHLVENKVIQAAVIAFTVLYVTNVIPKPQFVMDYFFSTVSSLLFAFIVLSAATGKFLFNLETSFLKRMGRYSYGMYVVHSSVLQLSLVFLLKFVSRENDFFYEIIYPLTGIFLVILISGLSYEIYEKRFLKLKKYFTVIQNKKV